VEYELAGETEVLGENLPQRHFYTTNPTWPDPGSNPGRRCGKPATNRLNYGTASVIKSFYPSGDFCCFCGDAISCRVVCSCCTVERHWTVRRNRKCVINVRRDVNVSHLLRICRCGMGDDKKSEQKCATFSVTDWGFN
jgi:hypothetical protein